MNSDELKSDSRLRERVEAVVEQIPEGRLMTYGQLAALCGSPRAARIVGGIAHFGDPKLPWHRVVKKDGSLAEGYPGGVPGHRRALEAEGVLLGKSGKVIVEDLLWYPADF